MGGQPGGEVRDRSEHAVVVPPLETDPSERRVPGCDADPEPELVPALPPERRELLEALLGRQRELDRLDLVILDRERVVEEDEQTVTCEVLERSVVRQDQLA